jgi:hypothetical protein
MAETVYGPGVLRSAFLEGMEAAQAEVRKERERRERDNGGLRKFICGALEDAERNIAADIVRRRRI